MCNFNKHDDDTKLLIHLFMSKCAEALGGANALLSLLESMRAQKPHPLIYDKCLIKSSHAAISWNKAVYVEKLRTLEHLLAEHKSAKEPNFNILEHKNKKIQKEISNTVKAMRPIEFIVKPHDSSLGGFEFEPFEFVEEGYVKLNPLFVAFFFCSVEYTKKALNYTAA
ncbi:MAG: hypothetical protein IE916_09110 [Epsilonproteobacteria bacterium]|nr:hypothetical protein [Campylobacterota bacterium]